MIKIQGGAKVGLQLFLWKITQSLIHNNTGINSVFCILKLQTYVHPTLYNWEHADLTVFGILDSNQDKFLVDF